MNPYSVSVIIPAYNAEKYLGEAIESVLSQTVQAEEIIVVDDGSIDDTRPITERFGGKVKYIFKQQKGTSSARNLGVQLASGEFLAFLDADDLWLPQKLELQLQSIRENRMCEAVFTHVENFISPELNLQEKMRFKFPEQQLKGQYASTLLVRRDSFLKIGLFNTDLQIAEFIDWWARAEEAGISHIILPATLVRRRVHGHNNNLKYHKEYPKIMRTILERRKKNDQ